MPILFYSTRERPYGCFSNFSAHGFVLDDVWWTTSEHYFQAQKFVGTPYVEHVRQAHSPKEAAHLGRKRDLPSAFRLGNGQRWRDAQGPFVQV